MRAYLDETGEPGLLLALALLDWETDIRQGQLGVLPPRPPAPYPLASSLVLCPLLLFDFKLFDI
eukprot:scaffold198580_cov39-Tisochrysis_lutea.AAC.2